VQGSATTAITNSKPQVDSGGTKNPGSDSSSKPIGNSADVKPATTRKPASPAANASGSTINAVPDNQTQSAPSNPEEKTEPAAAQPRSQEQPH